MTKRYPFKFLDAYDKTDTDIFFGRDEEIEALYQMTFQSDILLVYGASGTGKTSLIHCGLASRFQAHDWLALNIRRGDNLNTSLQKKLEEATAGDTASASGLDLSWLDEEEEVTETESPICQQLKEIYRQYFRPIYLIFDQFEELYVLGTKDEQARFIRNVQEISAVEQPVKMIFVIREEYLGHLFEFERVVPQLLRKKLRVEPMNLDKVAQVIRGAAALDRSNIRLQAGQEVAIIEGIFQKVKGNDQTLAIQLPYLQVFLDKLYLHVTGDEDRQADALFSTQALSEIGDIGDVLRDFLEEQSIRIQKSLSDEHPNLPEDAVWQILSPLATLEGTKEPMLENTLLQRLTHLPAAAVRDGLKALDQSRILRYDEQENRYEVTHDSLAASIADRRHDDEIAMLEIRRLITSQMALKTEIRALFTEKQLNLIDPYLDNLNLDSEALQLIERSRKSIEHKARRRRRNLIIVSMLVAAAVIGYSSNKVSQVRTEVAEAIRKNRRTELNQAFFESISIALKNSKNDRTSTYKSMISSIEDVNPDSMDIEVTAVAKSIQQNLLAEFTLYPFYKEGKYKSKRKIQKIIADDQSHYFWGSSDESPMIHFFEIEPDTSANSRRDSVPEEGLHFPLSPQEELSDNDNVLDLVRNKQRRSLISIHKDGKIWELKDEAGTARYIDSLGGNFKAMTPFKEGVLIAMDSIVYQIDLRKKRYPTQFKIGFDRAVKILVADPSNNGDYVVVKDGGNKILFGRENTIYETSRVSQRITCLAFSPNGKTIVAGFEGGKLESWKRSRPGNPTPFRGHNGVISCVTFSPDGQYILTGSWDQTAILWKINGEIVKKLIGHYNRITSIAYTQNNYAVTCAKGDGIRYWPLTPLSDYSLQFKQPIVAMATSPTGDSVAFSMEGDKGFFRLWNWTTGKVDIIWQPRKYRSDQKGVISELTFTENGKGILAASQNTRLVTLIDLSGKKANEDYRSSGKGNIPATDGITSVDISDEYVLIGNRKNYLSKSADGKKTFTNNHMVLLRERENPANFIKLPLPTGVNTARFSPDGKFVVAGCDNGKAYLWDIEKDTIIEELDKHSSQITSVAFSPKGDSLLTGSLDNAVIFWTKEEDQFNNGSTRILQGNKKYYSGHQATVNDVSFANQTDRLFISTGADKVVKLWNMDENDQIVELPSIIHHLEGISHAQYSWDDQYIITGSDDGSIRVWPAQAAELVIRKRIF